MKRSYPPKVHSEFDKLYSGTQTLRVRVLQYNHPMIGTSAPMLDIREWVTGRELPNKKLWTGFSPNGISLDRQAVLNLRDMLDDILEKIDEIEETQTA